MLIKTRKRVSIASLCCDQSWSSCTTPFAKLSPSICSPKTSSFPYCHHGRTHTFHVQSYSPPEGDSSLACELNGLGVALLDGGLPQSFLQAKRAGQAAKARENRVHLSLVHVSLVTPTHVPSLDYCVCRMFGLACQKKQTDFVCRGLRLCGYRGWKSNSFK